MNRADVEHRASEDSDRLVLAPRIRALHRVVLATRAVESILVGAGAGALVLAASIASGAGSGSVHAMVASCLGAAAAALSWWLEAPRDRRSVAKLVDGRQQLGGAVITAYELEVAGDRRPLGRMLAERTAASLNLPELRRSIWQRRVVVLAAPCACIALWSIVADQSSRRSAEGVEELWAAIEDEAVRVDAALSPRSATADGIARTGSLASLARSARSDQAAASAGSEPRDDALAARLREAAESEALTPELRRSLSRLSAMVDAARMRVDERGRETIGARERSNSLARERASSGDDAAPPDATAAHMSERQGSDASDAARAGSRSASASSPSSGPPTPDLARSAAGDLDSTSAETAARDASSSHAPPTEAEHGSPESAIATEQSFASTSAEAGVIGGVWWSERYDGIVERWVEMRRTSSEIAR